MPKPPDRPSAATALDMARAILGDAVRIVGASFSGNLSASGLDDDGRAVLSTGTTASDTTATSYIDIDFVPRDARLVLGLKLSAEEIPNGADGQFISDGASIWVNGAPLGFGSSPKASATGQSIELPRQTNPVADGIEVGMVADISVSPRQANSLRIATGALGAAFVFSTLAVQAHAMGNGKAVGNPGTGNKGNDGTQGNAGHAAGGNGGGGGAGGGGSSSSGSDSDSDSDSGIFQANDDTVDIFPNQTITVDLTANDTGPGQSVIFITEINGQAVDPGDTVTLETGETITLNADGTVTITADGDLGSTTFEYTAAYGTGNANQSDTAIVTINTVPCFVAGTMIRTSRGDAPVERLRIGDMVLTCDDGLQPIRWIGQRTLPAEGRMAPVRIFRGTFGDHQTLMVSPLHRVLVRNVHADLLFGSSEVLIAARDLIDGGNVRQIEGGYVHYVHLLFDRHQVVWSEGLETESFLPGPQTTHCFEEETISEICQIFPELDPSTGAGYGPAARPALKRFEAKLLAG